MSASALRSISNDALIDRLKTLVRRERKDTIAVLHHLAEVERRKLHLKLGHKSLFAYCTGALGYSESAAGRRIQAARCVRRYPFVAGMLERREVTLSGVTAVAGIALSRNEPVLFERIRGKTKDEVAAIVAGCRPCKLPRDRVKLVCVKREDEPAQSPVAQPPLAAAPVPAPVEDPTPAPRASHLAPARCAPVSAPIHSRGGSDSSGGDATPDTPTDTRYVVQFAAGRDLMRSLDRVRSLLSFRLPAGAPMEAVLAVLCEEFIERHSPSCRRARRARRTTRPKGAECPGSGRGTANTRTNPPKHDPRHIPAAVRDDVMAKGGGRCGYVGPDGRRCTATRHLQVDHIRPVALGGGADPDNLRVLCAAHNRLEAQRLLGAGVMARHGPRE